MTSLSCLTLIIAMEAGNQPIQTQDLIAEFALNKAEEVNKSLCESMKIPGLYSWHKGKRKPSELELSSARVIADHAIRRKTIKNYKFFNKCSGRKFAGMKLKSTEVCFYERFR